MIGTSTNLGRDEGGQMAITMLLTMVVVFMFFALALDAGIWYLDHRLAQNQAEAAALAVAQQLPIPPAAFATTAAPIADAALARNGEPDPTHRTCLEPGNISGDPLQVHSVRVCVRRLSPAAFAGLANISAVYVSAAATARVGRVRLSNVMPWGLVPPDPTCTQQANRNCLSDANSDADYLDPGDCDAPFAVCPWGLNPDLLYTFKTGPGSGLLPPGQFGAIGVCGQGANNYRECIAGSGSTDVFEEDEIIQADASPGNKAGPTSQGLSLKYPDTSLYPTCDVISTPAIPGPVPNPGGYDPDGRAQAVDRYIETPIPECIDRLVVIPIIDHFFNGSAEDIIILGIAVFGIAQWDRTPPLGNSWGSTAPASACGLASPAGPPNFECGMVWGYLLGNALPPHLLLQQITDSENPFAPMLIALTE